MQYEWDEAKRESNLRKHRLDFRDAYLVYEHSKKVTFGAPRGTESRLKDVALVEIAENVLSLVYVMRGESVRVISFQRHLEGKGGYMEFKGNLPSAEPSLSDWAWVKKQIAEDAPIPYDPNDPDDGPYDPNDDAAVEAFWSQATIWKGWPNQVLIQKDGVPVHPDGSPCVEVPENDGSVADAGSTRAKAS
jgi:uncharacterized DUF497 family protein